MVDRYESCAFCNPDTWRIVKETENFYVLLSFGQLVEGYCLLNSKRHFLSCAEALRQHMREFMQLKGWMKTALNNIYGECVFYEHGRLGVCEENSHASSYCFHAHLHCVPTGEDLKDEFLREFGGFKVRNWDRVCGLEIEWPEYLVYENPAGEILFASAPPDLIRPFYFRWLLAEKLGVPERACWRSCIGWQDLDRARDKFRRYVGENGRSDNLAGLEVVGKEFPLV